MAWMPKARPECRCQAPQPRSGAPKAQGLIAALRPQHNPPCRRSRSLPPRQPPITFHQRRCTRGASPSVSNVHQLDGRDPPKRNCPVWLGGSYRAAAADSRAHARGMVVTLWRPRRSEPSKAIWEARYARCRRSAGVEGHITSERNASEPERSHVRPQAAEPAGPHREGEEPNPTMHGHEKSDSAIVARKPPNKAGSPATEAVERRAEAQENANRCRTCRTQGRESVSQTPERRTERREASRQHPRWEQYAGKPHVRFCAGGAR
jgi:hypothetical protein